jgi:4-aminobutyrate aminotransferase-like enzyme
MQLCAHRHGVLVLIPFFPKLKPLTLTFSKSNPLLAYSYRAARFSHSCRDIYKKHLASFQHADCHLPIAVLPNDINSLKAAFATAEKHNMHVEALYMEPVMGEGKPGETLQRSFYDAARRLTKEHHSLLIIDSIQAALRAQGSLSICDYPGFADAEAPDMETYAVASDLFLPVH